MHIAPGFFFSTSLTINEAQLPSCTPRPNLAAPSASVAAVSDAVFLSGGPEGTFVVD